MKTKKTIIIIAASLSVIVLIVVAMLAIKNKIQIDEKQTVSQEKQIGNGPQADPNSKIVFSPEAKRPLPDELKGKIVGISPTSLVIDHPTGAYTVELDLNKIPVFKGAAKEKASALDLQVGITVAISVDKSTGIPTEVVIQ